MADRLQKILSQWGVASRRKAEQLIAEGQVQVNGATAHLGQTADPNQDQIMIKGKPLNPINRPDHRYILLHKPLGVVCTCHDPQGRKTVLDLLPPALHHGQGLHIVGRLDAESTGAVILTNNGALTFALTHPRHHVAKTYHVGVNGHPSPETLVQWREGVTLSGKMTLPAIVRVLSQTANQTMLEIVLREGRNRQIRRVADYLAHPVTTLHRVAIGTVHLDHLPLGHYRMLEPSIINRLQSLVPST